MKLITIVTASDGKNLMLAQEFASVLNQLGAKTNLLNLVEMNLPLYTPKAKEKGGDLLNPYVEALKAEGFVFVGPEYNGGITPSLTNFFAWASTSSKDWRAHFNAKKTAVATYSGGEGALFLAALRLQLSYIGLTVIGRQLSANDRKPADPKSINDICQQLLA